MMTRFSNLKTFSRKHFSPIGHVGGFLLAAFLIPSWPMFAYASLTLNVGLFVFSYVITPFAQLPSLWPLHRPTAIYESRRRWTTEEDVSCNVCGGGSCQRHRADLDPTTIQPWLGLLIHERVDKALEEVGELLLKDSVYPWLKDVSTDEDFVDELRSILRHVTAAVARRALKTDLSPFILTDVIREALRHVNNFLEARSKSRGAGAANFLNSSPVRDVQLSALSCLGSYMHVAVRNRDAEIKYLSNLVDALLPLLMPRAAKENKCVNALLREILVMKCILPLMDVLADPDILNYIAIVILDKDPPPVFTGAPSPKTTVLNNFALPRRNQPCITTLRYRLDDVMDDPSLLYYFMQFLKAEASVHVLQFCTTLQEFNNFLLNPELDEHALTALHREASTLYATFIARDASNRILFSDDIIDEVLSVVQGPPEDVVRLRRTNALFRAYEHAYTDLLENTFLPLFHQSDDFYRMLCGEREEAPRPYAKSVTRTNGLDAPKSASKFGAKIKGVFKTVADEVDFNDPIDGVDRDDDDDMFDEVDVAVFAEDLSNCAQDLSTWRVSIPSVAETPSEDSNKSECILNIEVHRVDCSEEDTIPQHWEIGRRYHEFYVLQSKLAEFHGEFEDCRLPAKKTFATKDLEFIEKSRLEFEVFLQTLLLKSTLKNSQLLQAFLSVDVEGNPFSSSFFPDLNIGKVFRKVPSKLIKEKGQHLAAFLQSFSHSTEQELPQVLTSRLNGGVSVQSSRASSAEPPRNYSSSSLASLTLKDVNMTTLTPGPDSLDSSSNPRHPLFGNLADIPDTNFPSTPFRLRSENIVVRTESDALCEPNSVYDFVLYVCQRLFRLPRWLRRLVHGIDLTLRHTLESFLVWFLARKLKQIFEEQRLEDIVHDIRDIVFFDEDPPRTEKEKKKRKEKLFKDMIDFLPPWASLVLGRERVYEGFKVVFDCLQQPVLNKQLVYCLLDVAICQIFPELRLQFQNDELVDEC